MAREAALPFDRGIVDWERPIISPLSDLADERALDYRHIALYSGRGAGKSHFFAEEAIERMIDRAARIACIREHQNSLRESVRQLMVDKITTHGLDDLFEITNNEIRGARNDSLAIFKGMQTHNADSLKSLEGMDVAWVEEAQSMSTRSLRILMPTIRKAGSQMWWSWNPRFESDAVDHYFRGSGFPPPRTYLKRLSWSDNPMLSPELISDLMFDYRATPDAARHVWGGEYETVSEGAYYAKQIKQLEDEGRLGDFPYDRTLPVYTSWDIGVDDYSAIVFAQTDGVWLTVIDFWETQGDGAEQIVTDALPEAGFVDVDSAKRVIELGRPHPFRYKMHFLPHDVKNREWGAGAKSRVEILKGLGVWPITAGTAGGPNARIPAVRAILPYLRINDNPRTRKLLLHLRRYSRRFNEQLQLWMGPLHDEHSHAADAFGELAVNLEIHEDLHIEKPKLVQPDGSVLLPGAPRPARNRGRLNFKDVA